jgi:hypothetical protein
MIAMTQATPRFASFEAYLSSNGDLEGRYYINNRAQYAVLWSVLARENKAGSISDR